MTAEEEYLKKLELLCATAEQHANLIASVGFEWRFTELDGLHDPLNWIIGVRD